MENKLRQNVPSKDMQFFTKSFRGEQPENFSQTHLHPQRRQLSDRKQRKRNDE